MTRKEESTIQEHLVTLYLRLNGYMTSGFIIHSSENQLNGEVDILSIRFPYHNQTETEHNSSEFLDVPENIDIIIAEVKSRGKSLKFNKSLYEGEAFNSWKKILEWIGLINDKKQIEALSYELKELVNPTQNSHRKNFRSIAKISTKFGVASIRPILFSPERKNINNADKFVNWHELNDFIWNCLCPNETREFCGTRYDFTAWGHGISETVKVYKNRQLNQQKFDRIEDLYSDIEILRNGSR